MFSKLARTRVAQQAGLNTYSKMGFKTTQAVYAKKLSIGEAVGVLESKITGIS